MIKPNSLQFMIMAMNIKIFIILFLYNNLTHFKNAGQKKQSLWQTQLTRLIKLT